MKTLTASEIIKLSHADRHSYKDLIPYNYGPGSHGYQAFLDYMERCSLFSDIVDFSKIEGLEEAWEKNRIEVYGENWRNECDFLIKNYIDDLKQDQRACVEFLESK